MFIDSLSIMAVNKIKKYTLRATVLTTRCTANKLFLGWPEHTYPGSFSVGHLGAAGR